jgi:hypothetical protein
MSLAEMRKELKELRKKAMPVPVSRMKKETVAAELERLRGKEEKAVKEAVKEAPKKVAKKVAEVQSKAHKEQDEVLVKKTAGVKRSASPPPAKKAKTEPKAEKPKKVTTDKPSKGSEEMRAKMAALRAMRKAKVDPEEE